ncbi:hypothetical protein B0H10DRAFT_1961350 [Mycena sp. CBHHK59/15]|nr:hypothetical protein B0H10DRAFT_1961350 [Mycena sp. CBHHK59/15]
MPSQSSQVLPRAFYILTVLVASYPLFKLHLNQHREARQPQQTAWLRSIVAILEGAFHRRHEHSHFPPEEGTIGPDLSHRLCEDLEKMYHLLGIDDPSMQLFPEPHTILCTTRINCVLCPNHGHPPTLCRHREPQEIRLLDSRFRRVNAELIAVAQENAILRFQSGWANFAYWLSDTIGANPRITTRQSQRLYFEHFARRLISAHGLEDTFMVLAHSSAHLLAESVRDAIGKDGGVVAEGAVLDQNENGVVDAPVCQENVDPIVPGQDISPELPAHPRQQERVPGSRWGYTRLAVMDGKTISHHICARQTGQNEANVPQTGPSLHSELPELNGTAGANVVHTFRARTTYCLQTVQWSCGCPIGWGKCYRSKSSSQVLRIINKIWEPHPNSRPGFLAYNNACNLLCHIVTQSPNSPWIQSTKLIVDAWHYIGHWATDILCRVWCNPASTNGSQLDLISVTIDNNGRTHITGAFNTETAEQLNAWLNGYEAQLRQMSNINYDFVVHILMLLYKELVDRRAEKKNEGLTEDIQWKSLYIRRSPVTSGAHRAVYIEEKSSAMAPICASFSVEYSVHINVKGVYTVIVKGKFSGHHWTNVP